MNGPNGLSEDSGLNPKSLAKTSRAVVEEGEFRCEFGVAMVQLWPLVG